MAETIGTLWRDLVFFERMGLFYWNNRDSSELTPSPHHSSLNTTAKGGVAEVLECRDSHSNSSAIMIASREPQTVLDKNINSSTRLLDPKFLDQ